MRHIEIRDLWLQKEVLEGKVLVSKALGTENPADLMTKLLSKQEIISRLGGMNLRIESRKGNYGIGLLGLVWGFGQLAGSGFWPIGWFGVLVIGPVSGVPLCFAWGGIVATSVGLSTSAVFTRVTRTVTNFRGVVAAGAVLPAS